MDKATLSALLDAVRVPENPAVLVGSGTADDGGVVKISDDLALVQTIDFFPPMVDDPTWFGRIGAANSISDIYAMGGVPVAAVCVYALPPGLPEGVAAEILNGAIETLTEAATPLVGGHTVKDHEVKFGLAVTGTVHPDKIVTNAGAKAGDAIVLTKPLGSGYLGTAIKRGVLPEAETLRVMEVMASLNKGAAEAMLEVGVHAATDITGFGVLGHAASMATASGTTIRLQAGQVPWIEGLEAFATAENTCGGLTKNLAYARGEVDLKGGSDLQHAVLADPQTSGGLFICVAADRLDDLLRALEQHGVTTRAVIGEVVEYTGTAVEVV